MHACEQRGPPRYRQLIHITRSHESIARYSMPLFMPRVDATACTLFRCLLQANQCTSTQPLMMPRPKFRADRACPHEQKEPAPTGGYRAQTACKLWSCRCKPCWCVAASTARQGTPGVPTHASLRAQQNAKQHLDLAEVLKKVSWHEITSYTSLVSR